MKNISHENLLKLATESRIQIKIPMRKTQPYMSLDGHICVRSELKSTDVWADIGINYNKDEFFKASKYLYEDIIAFSKGYADLYLSSELLVGAINSKMFKIRIN